MTLSRELESLLPPGGKIRFGELHLARGKDGIFSARHRNDMDAEKLEDIETTADLRELAKFTADGDYRPLKTAPTLRGGWKTECGDAGEFLKRLDAVYPGVFATWIAYDRGELDPVPLRRTLDRQTGMYRRAGTITDQMANQIMRNLCSPDCIRKIAWPIDDDCAVSRITAKPGAIPVVCTEACTLAVSEARRLAKEAYDKINAPEEK
ncbi:MAG: DR2241 family protein [Verrucomicrobiales bacterium]